MVRGLIAAENIGFMHDKPEEGDADGCAHGIEYQVAHLGTPCRKIDLEKLYGEAYRAS